MIVRDVRKQDVKADRIRDDELIVDHSFRGVQQNLTISELHLELIVDHDLVAVQEKVYDLRISVFIQPLKLRKPKLIDGFLLERVEIGWVMKSSGDDGLEDLRLLDTIAWLCEICLRHRSYVDQITGVVERRSGSRSMVLIGMVRLGVGVYVGPIGIADFEVRRIKRDGI